MTYNQVSLSPGFPPIPHGFQTEQITLYVRDLQYLEGSGALGSRETFEVRPELQEAPSCSALQTPPRLPLPTPSIHLLFGEFPPALLAGSRRQGGSHPGCSHHPGDFCGFLLA